MNRIPARALALASFLALAIVFQALTALSFSFSEEENKGRAAAAQKAANVRENLSTPCKSSLKGKSIALLVAERRGGELSLGGHGLLIEALNHELKALGLRTITQGEINARIAAAEMRAILNNDPDAALAASGRVGADFFIKGVITASAGQNKLVRANEVSVTMLLTLTDGRGRVLSSQRLSAESWAGRDVAGATLALIQDEGGPAVAQLYADFCQNAGK